MAKFYFFTLRSKTTDKK